MNPEPHFFASPAEFNAWLALHHNTETALIVGFHKVGTGKPSMSWSESVDEALCYGWIDGVRKSLGADAYCIRFTPRKKGSIWSLVNMNKVAQLMAEGRMQPAGMLAWNDRREDRSAIYAFEKPMVELSPEFMAKFEEHPEALKFFEGQAMSYRKPAQLWVMSAKQEETRQKRLATLIEDSAAGRRLKQYRR
jgi:uncharacterized protein YdeI (YjbR/CyaY-like superfamily)